MSKNVTYIKRHKKGFIYFHWINAVTFFLLFLTAMPLYTNKFLFLYESLRKMIPGIPIRRKF